MYRKYNAEQYNILNTKIINTLNINYNYLLTSFFDFEGSENRMTDFTIMCFFSVLGNAVLNFNRN